VVLGGRFPVGAGAGSWRAGNWWWRGARARLVKHRQLLGQILENGGGVGATPGHSVPVGSSGTVFGHRATIVGAAVWRPVRRSATGGGHPQCPCSRLAAGASWAKGTAGARRTTVIQPGRVTGSGRPAPVIRSAHTTPDVAARRAAPGTRPAWTDPREPCGKWANGEGKGERMGKR